MNIPTTHSCLPITPNDRYILLTRTGPYSFLSLFDHARCPTLHKGHALFKASLAKALAVETGKLQTWRFSTNNHALCPPVCSIRTLKIPHPLERLMLLVPIRSARANNMC